MKENQELKETKTALETQHIDKMNKLEMASKNKTDLLLTALKGEG